MFIPQESRQSERNLRKILPANIRRSFTCEESLLISMLVGDQRSKDPEESSCESIAVDLAGNNHCSKLDISLVTWIVNQLVTELMEQLLMDICECFLVGGIVMARTKNTLEGSSNVTYVFAPIGPPQA